MRPINVYHKSFKANDLKQINVINRVKAFAYTFGVTIVLIERPEIKEPYRLDFDAEGLGHKDIKQYSSICSQIGAILHFSNNLWNLTLTENRPEDGLTELQKTKKKIRAEKQTTDYFQAILNHYDQKWYLEHILCKEEYAPDEKINWSLNGRELRALKSLIPKIRDKVMLSGVCWSEGVAVSSFDALLTASLLHPYRRDFKNQFSLTIFDSDFLKIYRYVRPKFQPAGSGKQFTDLDSRIDKFFAEHSEG